MQLKIGRINCLEISFFAQHNPIMALHRGARDLLSWPRCELKRCDARSDSLGGGCKKELHPPPTWRGLGSTKIMFAVEHKKRRGPTFFFLTPRVVDGVQVQ